MFFICGTNTVFLCVLCRATVCQSLWKGGRHSLFCWSLWNKQSKLKSQKTDWFARYTLLVPIDVSYAGKTLFQSSTIAPTTILLPQVVLFWLYQQDDMMGRVGLLIPTANLDLFRILFAFTRCWVDSSSICGNVDFFHLVYIALYEIHLGPLTHYSKWAHVLGSFGFCVTLDIQLQALRYLKQMNYFLVWA